YSSSRPSSTETARLGSRTNSVSSQTRPDRNLRPLSLRYSSPQHSSYLQPTESSPFSQLYSTPYSALQRSSQQWLEKAPLIKLRTPPMGRRSGRSMVLANTQAQIPFRDMETPQSQAVQRAEAVSRLKLLPMPSQVQEQVREHRGLHFPGSSSS
ncbi:hypothetical protein XENOCAPTIV_007937, partial [Xenoophorus captivus]